MKFYSKIRASKFRRVAHSLEISTSIRTKMQFRRNPETSVLLLWSQLKKSRFWRRHGGGLSGE